MNAMIFAAGLGTRLRPLTNNTPKALVSINGQPLLELLIRKMIRQGFDRIIINVHHFADQIIDFIETNNRFGVEIAISEERSLLLNTGGGLKKAAWFFDDGKPFLVHNVDIISGSNLGELYMRHTEDANRLATLLVRHREGNRYFLFDSTLQLCGWENIQTGEKIICRNTDDVLQRLAFSGIQVIDPVIFKHIHDTGSFSIVKTYLDLAGSMKIAGYPEDGPVWIDVGTPEKLRQGEQYINDIR